MSTEEIYDCLQNLSDSIVKEAESSTSLAEDIQSELEVNICLKEDLQGAVVKVIEEEGELNSLETKLEANNKSKTQLYQDVQGLSQQYLALRKSHNRLQDGLVLPPMENVKDLQSYMQTLSDELDELKNSNDRNECKLRETQDIKCSNLKEQECLEDNQDLFACLESKKSNLQQELTIARNSVEIAKKLLVKSEIDLAALKKRCLEAETEKRDEQLQELLLNVEEIETKHDHTQEKIEHLVSIKGDLVQRIQSLDQNFVSYQGRCETMCAELTALNVHKVQLTTADHCCSTCSNPIIDTAKLCRSHELSE